jgi:rod shape-determining protein MreD
MIKPALITAAALVSLLLQARLTPFGIPLALTVVVAYYAGVRFGSGRGLLAGSCLGLLEDSLLGGIVGPNLLAKGVIGFFASLVSGGLFQWTPLLGIVAMAIATLIEGLIVLLATIAYGSLPAPVPAAVGAIVLQSLINAPAGYFIRPEGAE